MASKMPPQEPRSERFFEHRNRVCLLIFGFTFQPLFDQVLDTFGCLFGCLLGAFSGLLRFSWKPLDRKTLKNGRFFKVFENAAFWLFELLMALLGSSCPLFGRSDPKMGPKIVPKNAPQKKPRLSIFFFVCFFAKLSEAILKK